MVETLYKPSFKVAILKKTILRILARYEAKFLNKQHIKNLNVYDIYDLLAELQAKMSRSCW